jgi:hypothetical protein
MHASPHLRKTLDHGVIRRLVRLDIFGAHIAPDLAANVDITRAYASPQDRCVFPPFACEIFSRYFVFGRNTCKDAALCRHEAAHDEQERACFQLNEGERASSTYTHKVSTRMQ